MDLMKLSRSELLKLSRQLDQGRKIKEIKTRRDSRIKEIKRNLDLESVAQFAKGLTEAISKVGSDISLSIGIDPNFPGNGFGSWVVLYLRDEETKEQRVIYSERAV